MGRKKGSRDKNPEEAQRKREIGRRDFLASEEGKEWKERLSKRWSDLNINPNKDRIITIEEKKANKAAYSKIYGKKYRKTDKGIMVHRGGEAKRRRSLGFHPISLPLVVSFDWHHVNKNDVVAISREIHRAVSHKCGDGNKLEGVIG